MDNNARGISARSIGRLIGATSMEVNYLLKDQGFLDGEPGAYSLTPKGLKFGVQRVNDNGYGGYAFRSWETTHFDPSITEVLDASPERLMKVREDILARRQAQRAAMRIESAAAVTPSQASKGTAEHGIDPKKLLIVAVGILVVAGAGYGVYKGAQWYKRKKASQTEPGAGIPA